VSETAEQYRNRMLGNIKGQDARKVQGATPAKLARLLKGLSPAKLRKRPAPGKWSVQEIVLHLADTEIVSGFRVRLILGKSGTPIAAFDQDDWVVAGNYGQRDVATALAQFTALRASNLALLKTLRPEQWRQAGLHAERGEESVETIVAMTAGHDVNHLAQIERILKPAKGR
jgi:DinB family protein